MKVILSALVASSIAALLPTYRRPQLLPSPAPTYNPIPSPTYTPQGRIYAILRSNSDIAPDGSSYQYGYETENGISVQESGNLIAAGPEGGIAASGSYQFTSPEGLPVQITYVADQNGYRAQGNVLPTPPPIPDAILRSIAYNQAHPEPQTPGRNYYRR
ncbi:hypothetical protein NQ315_004930 [Exocentrus adspersus]|uniref:Uncharacterized protein n=1 Tax=Exocentrus adspersus TaxID=1586481 RepID=A0AAV8W3A7_9CUCU|nr:hypothetical protein NQ315_004930 [Exocentrus adspersus]